MPVDKNAPVAQPVQPTPDGTTLWNIQTQSPEWIPFAQIQGKLGTGAYRSYAGSDVPVVPGIGGEAALTPAKAATAVEGGATPTHSEAFRDSKVRDELLRQQYDNAGDKALAFVDGTVSGLSGGLLEGIPGNSVLGNIAHEKRQEYHPGYNTLGELAALAATVLSPESALKYSPLGASNTAFTKTASAVNTALSTRVGSSVVRRGVSDAVAGAVASGALATSHAVGQAVQGKPVSGYAIVDDIGLGTVIGFGVGTLGEAISQSARKAKDVEKQIQAAAMFDQSALPVRSTLTDVSKSWHSAHNVASARHDALDDLVKSGLMDAETPGAEWLAARTEAKAAADKARAKLHKVAGTEDPAAIGERIHDLAVSGKAKDAQKLYAAFDDYGTAVAHLDDVMQPTTFDTAHLGDVVGDIDLVVPASEHPMQRLEQMIENGSPTEEIERFAKQIDEDYAKGPKVAASDRPTGKYHPEERAAPGATPVEVGPAVSTGTTETETAGFQAKKILDQVRVERLTGVMSPVRPTALGNHIQGLLDELSAATGNRLGSPEARALATRLGMNLGAVNGPVSSRLADLWSLHRMSEALAATTKAGSKGAAKSVLSQALGWGAVSGAGSVGYNLGGAGAGGAARSLARQFLGTALHGAGLITAASGRFRQSAINGLAKVLTPTGRKLTQLSAIQQVVSSSYQPKEKPTTNYDKKATQLRWVLQNPEPLEKHLKESFKSIGAVDPVAYTAAVDAAMTRVKNLANALPTGGSWSMSITHKKPTEAQLLEWHQYEAVTSDRELVFKYLKTGLMPSTVVTAMNEQHPDFMSELRDYVLHNPDEVHSAPHATQMAMSKLLGVPLVPEANPLYVQRMQEPYIEAKQKAAQAKMQNQGAAAMQVPPPTPAQLLVIPR